MDEPIYLRRPNILPKKSSEYPLFLFISFMIPLTYWFEMWVVLPSLFADYPKLYWSIFTLGHFVLHNIVGNFLGILMCDTSIRGRKMPSETEPGVRFCSICDAYTPPRSFHCPSCDVCILKRDHHCGFTSCCVGFYNHRFFMLFAFYITLGTIVSLPFNVYFLWGAVALSEITNILIIVFPVLLFFVNSGSTYIELEHIYFFIIISSIFGAIFSFTWFYFHLKLVLQGTLVHEMRKCINTYNLGAVKNVQIVFGKKWYLTWISPYIKSPLICDGITFPAFKED